MKIHRYKIIIPALLLAVACLMPQRMAAQNNGTSPSLSNNIPPVAEVPAAPTLSSANLVPPSLFGPNGGFYANLLGGISSWNFANGGYGGVFAFDRGSDFGVGVLFGPTSTNMIGGGVAISYWSLKKNGKRVNALDVTPLALTLQDRELLFGKFWTVFWSENGLGERLTQGNHTPYYQNYSGFYFTAGNWHFGPAFGYQSNESGMSFGGEGHYNF